MIDDHTSERGKNGDLEAAATVIMERLAVTQRDAVSILCNLELPDVVELVEAAAGAARTRSNNVSVDIFPAGSRDGEDPPAEVAARMLEATAIILLTRFSLSHTRARMRATDAGARIASMPGITRDTFARALPADYNSLREIGEVLAKRLTAASTCRVTTAVGTEIQLSLEGRMAICDDGALDMPAAFGNLPAGEVYIAPRESETNGIIVFDGSLAEWGVLEEPLTVTVERGRAVDVAGGKAARWLQETLEAGGPNGRVIGELGIGTNPGARVSGNVLEDEKAAHTLHFAFGDNANMGGNNQASVHLDALVLKPCVELDGVLIRDNGHPVD